MDLSFDWVIGMKLVIPFFHLEFDARQLLVKRFGEIPPTGYFGGFLWLLFVATSKGMVNNVATYAILFLHGYITFCRIL